MAIINIEVNSEWFYHWITTETFKKIVLSGGLKPRGKVQTLKENLRSINFVHTANGLFYISLAKHINNSTYNSSYDYFIKNRYALVIKDIKVVRAHYIENNNDFVALPLLQLLPFPIRFSRWNDEYQSKYPIALEKMVGIKIPSKDSITYLSKLDTIDAFLKTMREVETFFPFIDLEEGLEIDPGDIRQYILNR